MSTRARARVSLRLLARHAAADADDQLAALLPGPPAAELGEDLLLRLLAIEQVLSSRTSASSGRS